MWIFSGFFLWVVDKTRHFGLWETDQHSSPFFGPNMEKMVDRLISRTWKKGPNMWSTRTSRVSGLWTIFLSFTGSVLNRRNKNKNETHSDTMRQCHQYSLWHLWSVKHPDWFTLLFPSNEPVDLWPPLFSSCHIVDECIALWIILLNYSTMSESRF